jgi:hypothetical protein
MKITIEGIAKTCHEANKAYCESTGDFTQPPWHLAEAWQKVSAMEGVKYKLDHPEATPEQMHEQWLALKEKEGWKYGENKDSTLLRHPCIMPYDELPEDQRIKDELFSAICNTLIPVIGPMLQASKKEPEVHPDDEALAMDANKPGIAEPKKKTLPSGKPMPTVKKADKKK